MDRKAWRGSTKTNSFAHFGRLHQFCHKELHLGFKGVGNFYSLQHFNTPKSAQKAQLAIILDWSITELLRRKGNTKKNSFLKSKSKNPWPQSSHSANCFLASSCVCSFHFSIQLYNDSKNRHMSNKNILKPVADFIQSEARPCLLCGMQAEQRSANSD